MNYQKSLISAFLSVFDNALDFLTKFKIKSDVYLFCEKQIVYSGIQGYAITVSSEMGIEFFVSLD